MMKNDLIERYIYAATRRMSPKMRADVSRELEGLIDDMLSERCMDRTPEEKNVRVVLTELGDPGELCEKYMQGSKLTLIGQPYYSTYLSVLRIVLICAGAGLTIATVIQQVMEPQRWVEAAAMWLASMWNGLLSGFAVVTLLFTFFYHKNVRIRDAFNPDELPPVPREKQKISRWECIAGIGFCVLFTVVFLAVPQIFSAGFPEEGIWISIFAPAAIRSTWYLIMLFALCGVIRQIVKLTEGRYSRTVLIVSLVTNGVSAVLAICWLTGFQLMNPEFIASMSTLFAGESEVILRIFSNFQYVFLGVILFALVLDTAEAAVRTLKS